MSNAIAEGRVALIHYTLCNDAGERLGSTQGHPPLPYLVGGRNIVPGLEKALMGVEVGATIKAVVTPEEGYGPRRGPDLLPVPRSEFPPNVELFPGMQFEAETDDGRITVMWVTDIQDDKVFVDHNHPLAGVTLHFEVEVVGVRGATPEELAHGHPHGPDGSHSHGH